MFKLRTATSGTFTEVDTEVFHLETVTVYNALPPILGTEGIRYVSTKLEKRKRAKQSAAKKM